MEIREPYSFEPVRITGDFQDLDRAVHSISTINRRWWVFFIR